MDQIRARAKQLYNALDFDRPINFGQTELLDAARAQGGELYEPGLHGGDKALDPVVDLADQIDFATSAGSYLFTGNRGTGKTTELMRLAKRLDELECEVFYADMSEYLLLTQRVEVTDFLISVFGALSEKVRDRFGEDPGRLGFFERVRNFLDAEVQLQEVTVPAGPVELKAALTQTPQFKEELQKRTRGHVQTLVKKAREFALEIVELVRARRGEPDKKVVLIVDSVERLRGVGDTSDVREVFKSAETLFASHADSLRFSGLSIVYTIPPYLRALAGSLGSLYAGGRIYSLPSVHVYEGRPAPGRAPQPSEEGLAKLVAVVDRRYAERADFFSDEQLERLAQSSGGDIRDFFRMLRLAVTRAPREMLPLPERVIEDCENAVRNDMLPIADDDRAWLGKIAASHDPELPSLDKLPDFARLQQGKYVLQYRNGDDWYALHPLLRGEIGLDHGDENGQAGP